jgi:hypothetical protein
MARTKRYTAKQEIKLDCGHTVRQGQPFTVTSVFACEQPDCPWRTLLASLPTRQREQQ